MGKHEAPAARKTAEVGKKRKVWPWVLLAALVAVGAYAAWFLITPPSQTQVGDPKLGPSTVHTSGDPEGAKDSNRTDVPDPSQEGPDGRPGQTLEDENGRKLKEGYYTILLAGTTDDYNTDTMMLCSVDTKQGKVNIVSINRDTQIDVKAGNKKINAAYGRMGELVMCQDVTEITGVPINFYVVVNMNAFKQMVDLIGGVQYDVPFNMVHPDLDKRFDINLKKGDQLLDGNKALQFVRFRSTSENDFGRVNRQKDFLIAAMKQVMKKFTVDQITDYIEIFNSNVKTNMTVREMVWFYTNVATNLNFDEDVHSDTLPYSSTGYYKGVAYVYLDPEQVVEFVNEYLNPYTTDLTTDDVNIPHLKD